METTVLAAGDAAMDVLLNVPYAPNGGRTVVSKDRYDITPGGSGAYTAVAARRAGSGSVLCSRVGGDELGTRFLRHLKEEDVSTAYVGTDSVNQTSLNVFLLEQYGLGGKVCYGGASSRISTSDIESAFCCYPDLFTASLRLDREVLKYAAGLTRAQTIPFVLDASGAYEGFRLSDILGVDVFVVGEEEAELLTGIKPSGTDNFMRVCIALCDMLPLRFVVLKLGMRGAYIYDGKYCELLMSPGLQSVDVTAEHESFVGAFSAHFAKKLDVLEATKYALAASSLAASRVGGFASIPTDEEITNIL